MHGPRATYPYLMGFALATLITAVCAAEPLIVGADVDYAPFSFLEDGRPTGFDIEMFNLIAQEMGLDVSYQLGPWNEILKSARAGTIDTVLGVVYTAERDQFLDFTEPYNMFQFALLVHPESDIGSVDDLDERKLAYLQSDAVAKVLIENADVRPVLVGFETLTEAVRSVARGENEAVITPMEWLRAAERESVADAVRVVNDQVLVSTYRIAVAEHKSGLEHDINQALQTVLKTDAFSQLEDKWFAGRTTVAQSSQQNNNRTSWLVAFGGLVLIAAGTLLFWWLSRKSW